MVVTAKPAPNVQRSSRLRAWKRSDTWAAWLFIAPSLLGLIIFYVVPFGRGLLISFSDWNLLTPAEPVGLANYSKLLADATFWRSLWITLSYVVINVTVQIGLSIGLAAFIARFTQSVWVRGLLILPYLLSNVVVALLWLWMLDPLLGVINEALMAIGIGRQAFLGSPQQAIATIAAINIWRHLGYSTLLIFAGMQVISKELYEAGAIDGAGEWHMFWKITLPLLRPVLVFVLVTGIIGSFQIFDTIAVTTQGGPANATRVIVWYIYEYAFVRFEMGYATTLAMALFLILLVVTAIQMRLLRAGESDL